jgi:hypothetical protein
VSFLSYHLGSNPHLLGRYAALTAAFNLGIPFAFMTSLKVEEDFELQKWPE